MFLWFCHTKRKTGAQLLVYLLNDCVHLFLRKLLSGFIIRLKRLISSVMICAKRSSMA